MTQMPAISLAAVPGRRKATIELAQEIEKRGFSGIYGPSLGDSMALCEALALATNEITFGTTIMHKLHRSFTKSRMAGSGLALASVTRQHLNHVAFPLANP